jgi:dipeptidyl aminopeptidase/acylaminoacyl peptidase
VTDVGGILTDPVTGLWIGVLTLGDQPEPHFFDPKAQARVAGALKAFAGLTARLRSYTSDLGRMIIETSGAGDSGTFWLVDVATGKADPIGAAYPDVKAGAVGPIEIVRWSAADGLALSGVLSLPPDRPARRLPLIVMPHGGPEDRDYPVFNWWAQLFASRGYAVFQPNFRGSSGYGAPLLAAGFGEYGHKMLSDISDGVAALAQKGVIDPKRACIVGWSYGGYAAEAGVTLQHGLYRCAVAMAGLSDLPRFLGYVITVSGPDGDSLRYWRRYMGAASTSNAALAAISPARHAADADAPLLLIHGKDDSVVPIEQSLQMQRALKAAGKPVELVTLPNADHWLLHEDTRLAMAKASLDFVLKYNPPAPEPTAIAAAKP